MASALYTSKLMLFPGTITLTIGPPQCAATTSARSCYLPTTEDKYGQVQSAPISKGASTQPKKTYQGGFKYTHVYGHMDHHLSWLQLSLTQQLNCVCNTLEKMSSNKHHYERLPQQSDSDSPRKDVALIVWGNKIMGNISSSVCFMQVN